MAERLMNGAGIGTRAGHVPDSGKQFFEGWLGILLLAEMSITLYHYELNDLPNSLIKAYDIDRGA